jgi:ketosteroid isomerase-like protein
MSEHPNATIIRNMWDAVGRGDMAAFANVIDDDVVWYEIGNPEPVRGKAALVARWSGGSRDFEMKGETHDVVGSDDHVVALLSVVATRSDKSFPYRVAEIYHLRDGRITERWAFSDDTAAIASFFGPG